MNMVSPPNTAFQNMFLFHVFWIEKYNFLMIFFNVIFA
jgi:hypothetical protein